MGLTRGPHSTDWMNADPDVALPFAHNLQGQLYDPIYHDSKQANNIDMNTVYKSPGLVVISVTMFWGVALKLIRYKKESPTDIAAMLRHGTKLNTLPSRTLLIAYDIKQFSPTSILTTAVGVLVAFSLHVVPQHVASRIYGEAHAPVIDDLCTTSGPFTALVIAIQLVAFTTYYLSCALACSLALVFSPTLAFSLDLSSSPWVAPLPLLFQPMPFTAF